MPNFNVSHLVLRSFPFCALTNERPRWDQARNAFSLRFSFVRLIERPVP